MSGQPGPLLWFLLSHGICPSPPAPPQPFSPKAAGRGTFFVRSSDQPAAQPCLCAALLLCCPHCPQPSVSGLESSLCSCCVRIYCSASLAKPWPRSRLEALCSHAQQPAQLWGVQGGSVQVAAQISQRLRSALLGQTLSWVAGNFLCFCVQESLPFCWWDGTSGDALTRTQQPVPPSPPLPGL